MAQGALFELQGEAAAPGVALPYRDAMREAGRILARRPHTESEFRTKLRTDPETEDAVVDRLIELGLLDDAAFARQWVHERGSKKGPLALRSELEAKGVAAEAIDEALGTVETDEEELARSLAVAHLRKVRNKPLQRQAFAIHSMLLRRGFSAEIAESAARSVLPPVGWD